MILQRTRPPWLETPFDDGPGVEAISNNCVACHSVDHVMNQPRLAGGLGGSRQKNGPRLQGADKSGGPGENHRLPGIHKRG